MQPLKCLRCGHYLGRYKRGTAATIEQELYCMRCKGHTEFTVQDGDLCAHRFIPRTAQGEPSTEDAAPECEKP